MSELKYRWGVSKEALFYRGRQLGGFTEDQVRAGYSTLKRYGEATEEREEKNMPIEQPELVNEGLRVMTSELGMPPVAVARKMRVQQRLLNDLFGSQPEF
jgi:Zn-dependent peptidase ImmA (M78 family)